MIVSVGKTPKHIPAETSADGVGVVVTAEDAVYYGPTSSVTPASGVLVPAGSSVMLASGAWFVASGAATVSSAPLPPRVVASDEATDFVSEDARDRQYPVFAKHAGPIFTLADADAGTAPNAVFWPWVINVTGLEGASATVGGPYWMYYSTDHGEADGHIRLATASSPTGPWTDRGEIYRDVAGGEETETPSVMYQPDDPAGKPFYMYYQQVNPLGATSGIAQHTLLARSANGVTGWERVGIVLPLSAAAVWQRPVHTGYARPFVEGGLWKMYSYLGGGDFGRSALSYSKDGLTWYTDPRQLGGTNEHYPASAAEPMQYLWLGSQPITWRDRRLLIGLEQSYVSGYADRQAYLNVSEVSPDGRHLVTPPRRLFVADQAWESNFFSPGSVLVENGRVYVYYRSNLPVVFGGPGEGFNVAYADVGS